MKKLSEIKIKLLSDFTIPTDLIVKSLKNQSLMKVYEFLIISQVPLKEIQIDNYKYYNLYFLLLEIFIND